MPSSAEFIDAARGYIGTRWMHQGRSARGIDCVGLVLLSAAQIGIEIPDMQGYRRSPNPALFLGHIRNNTIPADAPVPGTIGVFRDGNQPCHVGIFATLHDQLSLIHAYAGTGLVMEEVFIHDWPKKLIEIRAIESLL